MQILEKVKVAYDLPIVTDVRESSQVMENSVEKIRLAGNPNVSWEWGGGKWKVDGRTKKRKKKEEKKESDEQVGSGAASDLSIEDLMAEYSSQPPQIAEWFWCIEYVAKFAKDMSRSLVSEAVKKKLRVDKDDAKKVVGDVKLSNVIDGIERLKNIFIGVVMILLALIMESIEVGFSGGGSGRYVRIGCEDKADVDIVEIGIVLGHISQRRCYKKVHITMLEYLLDMRQQILEELRTGSFEATMERSRADAGRETEAQVSGSTYGRKATCAVNPVTRSNSKWRSFLLI